MLARLIEKIFKRGLTVKKLSQVVQRIWRGRREDWCLRWKPLSRTGPGSNQRPTTHPSLHTAIGFSLTIQGLIDEPLFVFQPCTFLNLKSQFILGERERRREQKKNFKTRSFFFLSFSTPCQRSSVIHQLSKHFVSPSLIVSALHPHHVRRRGGDRNPGYSPLSCSPRW